MKIISLIAVFLLINCITSELDRKVSFENNLVNYHSNPAGINGMYTGFAFRKYRSNKIGENTTTNPTPVQQQSQQQGEQLPQQQGQQPVQQPGQQQGQQQGPQPGQQPGQQPQGQQPGQQPGQAQGQQKEQPQNQQLEVTSLVPSQNISIKSLSSAVTKQIEDQINFFRNKLANGILEFKVTGEQKVELQILNPPVSRIEGTTRNKEMGKFPSAENMKRTYWSGELEIQAQKKAEQCSETFTPNSKYGEIISTIKYNGKAPEEADWKKAIEDLTTPPQKFEMLLIDDYQYKNTENSNFAQLIYSDLSDIGCASYKCLSKEDKIKSNNSQKEVVIFVCFTGKVGPSAGEKIYSRPKQPSGIGAINCSSSGDKGPYLFLCPKDSKKKLRKSKK